MIDLSFSEDGDFILDRNNSLKIIDDTYNDILKETIMRRIQSSTRDWDNENIKALSLDEFRGERLTSDVVQYLKFLIYKILTDDGLVGINEVFVSDSPFTESYVAFSVVINRKDKYGNDLIVNFGYDMRMNKIMPRFINPKESLGWQE
jgi:hypothetical protein